MASRIVSLEKPELDVEQRQPYSAPRLEKVGTLAELTQGFSGSIPDEQGGQTKRNPYQG